MQRKTKQIEVTPQLLHRLYPERLKRGASAECKVKVKTLTEEELRREKLS